jgi:hypothetical protein
MYSTSGREGCIAMLWTQWPTSASGSGMNPEFKPLLIGRHDSPASSVRKVPAAEMAAKIRSGSVGSSRMVCRHSPPAPGCQLDPEPCPRSPESSCHVWAPSVERNRAASSTPA